MHIIDKKMIKELETIVQSLEVSVGLAEKAGLDERMEKSLEALCVKVNSCLYGVEMLDADMFSHTDIIGRIRALLPIWRQAIDNRRGLGTDSEFWSMYDYYKYVDKVNIILNAVGTFFSYPEDYKQEFRNLQTRYTFLEGKIDISTNDFSLITQHVEMMKEHIEDFKWLYDRLADYRSKKILLGIVKYWTTFDVEELHLLRETVFPEYYDTDILEKDPDEVFVDCGAFVGDSIEGFIEAFGNYKTIYGYEIMPETMEKMKEKLESYPNIVYRQKGVGSKSTTMYIDGEGAGAHISENGKTEVSVVALDDDIDDKITMVKMDIEGAEKDALKGARRHIIEDKPRLLICTYHKPSDIFEIPRLIDGMRDDYKFYLRINGLGCWPVDHVIFAV